MSELMSSGGGHFDHEVALATFRKRYLENRRNQSFDNSTLPAGSPMYYFCRGCFKLVDVKSELWVFDPPPKYCEACAVLARYGLLEEAKESAERQVADLPKVVDGREVCESCHGRGGYPACTVCHGKGFKE